jgi:hypothetical protein
MVFAVGIKERKANDYKYRVRKASLSLIGKSIHYPDPEYDFSVQAHWYLDDGLLGIKYGMMTQLAKDLLNKFLYRIELTARYKYPIPNGDVALDMLGLSGQG